MRLITMCTILVVLAMCGAWSYHSIGQDLFDDAPADSTDGTPDDIFSGEDTGDLFDSGPSDAGSSDDDLFGDDSIDDSPTDDLLPGSDDDIDGFPDESTADATPLSDDLDLDLRQDDPTPADNTDALDLGDATADEAVIDDTLDLLPAGNSVIEKVENVIDLRTDVDYGASYELTVSPRNHNAAQQARQRLVQLQQALLKAYMQTKNKSTRDKLVSRLTSSVSDEFDVRQKARSNELKALEQELNRLRSIHQQRQREKNTIVRNRVRQLIRDKEGLGWGSERAARRFR